LSDVRNNKHIARRGGWKRLCIIVIVLLFVVIALAVGLGVGLKNKKKSRYEPTRSTSLNLNANNTPTRSSDSPATSSTSSADPTGPFPVGKYSIVTFLDTVATGCTSNPATWLCYPYTTYNQSATQSAATFDWVINSVKPTASSSSNLTISSTSNPFALAFKDVPLDMLDRGQSTERYRFQVPMDKLVVPTASITNDNSRASCWFNGTTFQAQLYTKRAKTYPAPDAGPPTSGGTPTAGMSTWPFAVDVKQVIGGGDGIPECFKVNNGEVGARITEGLESKGAGGLCSCAYRNFNEP
jgi:hypothetical protein